MKNPETEMNSEIPFPGVPYRYDWCGVRYYLYTDTVVSNNYVTREYVYDIKVMNKRWKNVFGHQTRGRMPGDLQVADLKMAMYQNVVRCVTIS
jgi:hypothetical protein